MQRSGSPREIAAPGSVVTITGILHAVSVRDGAVISYLYPDSGAPPLRIADDGLHVHDIVAALDDIVTLSGTAHWDPDGSRCLTVHDVNVAQSSEPTSALRYSSTNNAR